MTRRSRRRVLAATGTAITAALAGCGGVSESLAGGDDDTVTYDQAALTDLAERSFPRPPAAFPVSIPSSAFDRHRSRIRTLLDEVPTSPALPNGALSAKLSERRSEVTERFRSLSGGSAEQSDGSESESALDRATPRERLEDLRSVRTDAAGLNAAYRAATGEIDLQRLRSRRETVRSALDEFRRSWTYAGASPLDALVVHNAIEDLVMDVRYSLRDGASLPERPRDAPFEVRQFAASVEDARATLADAELFRTIHRESAAEPTSYRETIRKTAEQLSEQYEITAAHADIHEYTQSEEPPFDRSIEGTPAGELYQYAREHVGEEFIREPTLSRQPANRSLEAAVGLAGIYTFRSVVEGIRAGSYGVPDSVGPIAEAYTDAVDALRMVWEGEPRALRLELDWPATESASAWEEFRDELSEREGGELSTYVVSDTYGGLLYAYRYATYVPPAAEHLLDVLRKNRPGE